MMDFLTSVRSYLIVCFAFLWLAMLNIFLCALGHLYEFFWEMSI